VPLDHLVDLRVEPAGVAKLDGDRPGEVCQEHLEQLRVPLLSWRELEEDGARPVPQGPHPGTEVAGDDVLRKAGRRVGERALGLQAEPEFARGVAKPLCERRLLRDPLEGVVDLHRVQLLGVGLEKAAGRQVRRVEGPTPLRVAEAAGADVEGHRSIQR
jgi:hypothetical protein